MKDDSIVDDVYKYIENPSCSVCIAKLQTFVNNNVKFINSIIPDLPHVEEAPVNRNITSPSKVAGEVYEIEADPQQYKELIELSHTQRWIYRGINILESTNSEGKKVWNVFFF